MWNAFVRALGTLPNRDVKIYNRLILGSLAGWSVVVLSVVAIAGLSRGATLIAIACALGLSNVTARWIDHRYLPPTPGNDHDEPG